MGKVYHWLKERKINLKPTKCDDQILKKHTSIPTFDFSLNKIKLYLTKVFEDLEIIIAKK